MLAQQEQIFDAALMYAAAGLSVFPAYRNKKPVVKWQRCQEQITNEVTIRKWFAPGRYNVAIVGGAVSGGLVVLDFDHNADEVYPAWCAYVKSNYVLPEFPVSQTGKGYHVFFRCHEPGNNKMLAGHPVPKPDEPGKYTKIPIIETRAEGGYVLAPPSIHETGKVYTLLQGDLTSIPFLDDDQAMAVFSSCSLFDEPMPEDGTVATEPTGAPAENVTTDLATEAVARPELSVTKLREETYVTEAFKRETEAVKGAQKGNRNNQLFRSTAALAGLVAGGLTTVDQVRQAMLDAAGPLLQEEPEPTKKTIESGLRKGQRTARQLPPPPPVPHPNGVERKPAPKQEKAKPKVALNIDLKFPKTKDYHTALEWLGYEFKLNEMGNTLEVNGEPLTDGIAAAIYNRMRDIGLGSTGWVSNAFIQMAHENAYNPVKRFLDDLKWDGFDHIGNFVGKYLVETTGLGHAAFKRWFIGAVAKVFEHAQNFMLVWDGPQDTGKSTLARWLCPLPDYFIEGPIKPDDKDYLIRMCTKFIWEVSELQSTTRKADREALKGFITMQEVTARKAFGKYDMVKPTMVSMVGTINEDGAGFLTDPTGNRRFVVIRLGKIDWNYTKLDVSQIWAQAVALYRQGEPWRLNQEEKALQRSINSQYEMTSVLSTYFFEFYRVDPTSQDYTLTYEILQTLETAGLKGSQQANLNELGRLLKKLGAESIRVRVGGKRPRAFRGVIRLEPEKLTI